MLRTVAGNHLASAQFIESKLRHYGMEIYTVKHFRLLLTAFIALALVACAAMKSYDDIKVETNSDPKVDLGAYKSYAWLAGAAVVIDEHNKWVPPGYDATAEFKHQLDAALRKKGLSENNINPDMVIAFAAGIDMDAPDIQKNAEDKFEIVGTKPQGGILLIFGDTRNGQAIWAGAAQGDAKNTTMEESKDRIRYVVSKMMETFK